MLNNQKKACFLRITYKLINAKISFNKKRQLEIPVLLMIFQPFNETFWPKFNINIQHVVFG